MAESTRIIQTGCGKVRGKLDGSGRTICLGLPYAKAERFCPPQPVCWEGILDCLAYRGTALQPDRLGEYPAGKEIRVNGREDCLHLNIWAAEAAEGEKLPVVVYIHGGAFQVGSAQKDSRAGDLFMEKDRMVFVSVEYRLGVLGFLQLGEDMGEKYRHSGNAGALDVLAAMGWVHEHIAAFGGDPERVTLFGISAGAKLIGSLLTVPRMKELCRQIVLESGAMQSFRTRETARKVALDYEALLGISDERELLSISAEKLVEVQARFCSTPGSTCFFGPVLEDDCYDPDWVQTLESGNGWRGNAILGSNRRELAGLAERADFSAVRDEALKNLFGNNQEIVCKAYESLPHDDEQKTWTKVLSDFMYRSSTDRFAKRLSALGDPLWVYSFEYFPAVHGMGFSFLMGECGDNVSDEKELAGRKPVAEAMRCAVRRFICTGTPGEDWPFYLEGRKMIFDAHPHLENRPADSLAGVPEMVFQR